MEDLISIIMPTYKRSDLIEKAIASIENQTYKNWELIIVDDNQKDSEFRKKTEEKLLKYKNNPKIKYIQREENGGGALARNTGIENARGKYIAFLDDDDEYEKTKLEKQLKVFKDSNDKNLAIVTCQMVIVDESGKTLKIEKNEIKEDSLKTHLLNGLGFTGTLMIKKDILIKCGMFTNTPSLQEYIMLLKILEKGYKAKVVSEPLFKLYQHSGERITNGTGRIKGHKLAHELAKKNIEILDEREKKAFEYNYLYNMAYSYMINKDRKESLSYFYQLLKLNFWKIRNIDVFFVILLGYNELMRLKRWRRKI